MTMCTIILKGNKQYKHVLCNWNGLASIKFGLGASFLALSLVDRNSPGGLGGGVFVIRWKIKRAGGVIAYLKKRKIRGGGGS